MRPAMLFHRNIKSHVYKPVNQFRKYRIHLMVKEESQKSRSEDDEKNPKKKPSYTNVSANDDSKWKNDETNRCELSDRFEYV